MNPTASSIISALDAIKPGIDALAELALRGAWPEMRPMEDAPKGRRILILDASFGGRWVVANWCDRRSLFYAVIPTTNYLSSPAITRALGWVELPPTPEGVL